MRDIAQATLLRRSAVPERTAQAARPGKPIDPTRDDVCLVTGASGFIGGHVAQRLLREGYQVRCLVRASSDTSFLDTLDVEIAVGDLTKAPSLLRVVEGCRFVVHCGAMVSDWGTRQEISRINVQGTRNILEAASRASVDRFVHVSTTDIYGYPGGKAVDEAHVPTSFKNWYSQTKLAAEAEVRRFERERSLRAVILRPATVYGPRSVDVIGKMAKAIRGGHMLLIGGGRALAGVCYIDNFVDAALLALRHERAPGHAFNISDGVSVTWKEFTDDLAQGLGCPPVRFNAPYGVAAAAAGQAQKRVALVHRLPDTPGTPV